MLIFKLLEITLYLILQNIYLKINCANGKNTYFTQYGVVGSQTDQNSVVDMNLYNSLYDQATVS